MTYVGVEHELGEWLGSCALGRSKTDQLTTWKPTTEGYEMDQLDPIGSKCIMDIFMKCNESYDST